jgi:acetyltransferase-like isoleucine patch superfamily enzyme
MNLLILGAGSHGLDVYEIAKSLRIFSKISFLDDDQENDRAIGPWNMVFDLLEEYPLAVVAVGDEDVRREWMLKLNMAGFITPTLIHPTAYIPDDTEIGIGTVICARATIGTAVKIGKGCIVTSGSNVPRKTYLIDWQQFEFDKIIRERGKYSKDKNSGMGRKDEEND